MALAPALSSCLSALVQLLLLAPGASIVCQKARPRYSPDALPRFTGSTGPFGTVCEVRGDTPFPQVPRVPTSLKEDEAFVVRSSFPDDFMEESRVVLRRLQTDLGKDGDVHPHTGNPYISTSKESTTVSATECGNGMSVATAGSVMDEQVMGMSAFGSGDDWLAGCASCGATLAAKGMLKSGWFCQLAWLGPKPLGVWLKRLGDANTSTKVRVDMSSLGHEILGFGGAFTDAAAAASDTLQSPSLKTKWVEGYYGQDGAGYTMGRLPFGGADFSRRPYSLDDVPGDLNLTHMCLRDDRENASCGQDAKLDIIKEAMHLEPDLKLFFSPWSAPPWMKTSGSYAGGSVKGLGRGPWNATDKLLASAWAQSFVKFVDLLAEQGVKVWGLTLQNEPGNDLFVTWNANAMSPDAELSLLQLVGPLMRKKYPHIKIMVHDDQVYSLEKRLVEQNSGILTSEYMDGVAFHWYGSLSGALENVTKSYAVRGLPVGPEFIGGGIEVREIYQKYIAGKGKFMLGTEACNGWFDSRLHLLEDMHALSNNRGVRPGDWSRGYRYSRNIFYNVANGASGWTDWNLLLTSDGGPNWAHNNVDAPILVSPDGQALWVSPMFFHLAHWAKYVIPGSRVLTVERVHGEVHEVAAFLRPDKRIVVVALCDRIDGQGDPPANQVLQVEVGGFALELQMKSRSIVTAVFAAPQTQAEPPVFV